MIVSVPERFQGHVRPMSCRVTHGTSNEINALGIQCPVMSCPAAVKRGRVRHVPPPLGGDGDGDTVKKVIGF
jgi:hypothetical protein